MSHECPRCITRGQTWPGSPPVCGFLEDGTFTSNNWNCATLNLLRELTDKQRLWADDDNAVMVRRPDGDAGFIVLCWHKQRGRVNSALVIDSDGLEPLTLELAEAAIRERLCQHDGCERPAVARGFCSTHYRQARRDGRLPLKPSRSPQLEALKAERRPGCCAICEDKLPAGRRVLCGKADCERVYNATWQADARKAGAL